MQILWAFRSNPSRSGNVRCALRLVANPQA
jgi:hypothetical protein